MIMQNNVSDRAFCIRDTRNIDGTKVLRSDLIYQFPRVIRQRNGSLFDVSG